MIGYVTLGTNDIDAAAAFYDQLLGTLGARRGMNTPRVISWSLGRGNPGVAVAKPYDGAPATPGNGGMTALSVDSRDKVDAFHAKALELGGTDEGAVAERFKGFYAGYFRDLDGNKLCIVCMG
jgi:catechol 2,3-dioxygenase-like lactoylglutathione lyase family enzyme